MSHPPCERRFAWSGRIFRVAGPSLLLLLISSCAFIEADPRMSALEPAGPFARQIDNLFWPVFWIAVGVFAFVQLGILAAVIFFRDRPGRKEPKQVHGNTKLEVTWTVIPALILAGIAIPTVRTVFDLTECEPDALPVELIGHQWWFEYNYPDAGVNTANVLVIPAEREVCLLMTSEDVIHNFWVPALNGKRYVIPGQVTTLRLEADQPGEYWGHCGEFCGLSHSLMRARVQALPEAEFEQWLVDQSQPADLPPEGTLAFEGLEVYLAKGCTQCHNVDYGEDSEFTNIVSPDAFQGPNLTHFASRNVFAGAYLPYEGLSYEEALALWLAEPPDVKPGSYMPDLGLTAQEIEALIAWLETLE